MTSTMYKEYRLVQPMETSLKAQLRIYKIPEGTIFRILDKGEFTLMYNTYDNYPPKYDDVIEDSITYKRIYSRCENDSTHVVINIPGEEFILIVPENWIEED